MDPLTALSAAGTIVQFVDFALKILTTGHALYKSTNGSLKAHEEMRCVATDLSVIAQRLNRPEPLQSCFQPGRDEAVLEDLCQKCKHLAQEMLAHLETLRIQGKKSAWKSFRIALKATWDKKELDSFVQRIHLMKKAVESWFLVDIRCAIFLPHDGL